MRKLAFSSAAALTVLLAVWALGRDAEPVDAAAAPSTTHGRPESRPLVEEHRHSPSTLKVTVIEEGTRGRLSNARVVRLRSATEIAWSSNVRAEWTCDAKGQVELDLSDLRGPTFFAATAAGHIWSRALPPDGAELRLEVPAAVEVRGQILRLGGPAEGATVEIRNEVYSEPSDLGRDPGDSWSEVTTDSNGAFVLWARPGSAVITAGGALFRSKSVGTPVPGSQISLALEPAAGLRGRVETANGKPAIGARVTFAYRTAEVGEDGRFELGGLDGLEGELSALLETSAGNETKLSMARVELGQWTTANLRLETAGLLEGTVLDARGQPVRGTTITATELYTPLDSEPDPLPADQRYGPPGSETLHGLSGAGGRFSVATRSTHGNYLVRGFTPSASGSVQAASAQPGAQSLLIRLTDEDLVTGAVVSADGPLDEFRVRGALCRGSFSFARSSLSDSFVIDAAGHRAHAVDLSAFEPGAVSLGTIVLTPTHQVTVEVEGLEDGTTPELTYGPGGSASRKTTFIMKGRATLEDLELPLAVRWLATEHHVPVRLELGPDPTITVRLSTGGSLHFQVNPPDERAFGRLRVSCEPPQPFDVEHTGMLSRGEGTVSGLSGGHCRWHLGGRLQLEGEVDARPIGAVEVAIPWAMPSAIPISEDPDFLQVE